MVAKVALREAVADAAAQYKAVATLYHSFLTGLILSVNARRGEEAAGEMIFRVYRQHHLNKFLPGLPKLGLADKPHAVAAAQYHYLSNTIGGVRVEWMPESDTKSWVRFVHPRWIYEGSAIAGVPLSVSRAMLRAWYAHNGVSLGNPRLGFVCTSEDMDGQYGLAGYFQEFEYELSADERLQFSPGERPPPFDPNIAPQLDISDWPQERLEKANRNYAMDLIRLILPIMVQQFGQDDAAFLGNITGKLLGLQNYEAIAGMMDIQTDSVEEFARLLTLLSQAQGDECVYEISSEHAIIRQVGWRLMRGQGRLSSAVFDAWNGLWQGLLISHNRFLTMEVMQRMDYGDNCFEWRIRPRGVSAAF